MTDKIDIRSSTLDKGLEIAKDFVDKLIMPATEEVGLLLKETVSLWRMKNQIRVLTKAKAYCEEKGIEPSKVSPKLLLPLLDGAALEDDELLQDKWAVMLGNLVDSDQNIQNHVFPYILGQISLNEYLVLERVAQDRERRIARIETEITEYRANRPTEETRILSLIRALNEEIATAFEKGAKPLDTSIWNLQTTKRNLETELRGLDWKELAFRHRLKEAEEIPEDSLQEFEMSNVIRLGLARNVQETHAENTSIEIPNRDPYTGKTTVDLAVDVYSESKYVLTELGALFIRACTPKDV